MRISVLLVTSAIAGTAWFAACGGGGGGSGGDDTNITDAGSGSNPGSGMASEGIGKICNGTTMCAAGFDCLTTSQTATNGFCGFPCGSTTTGQPPSDGAAKCAAATPKSPSGTPLCAIGLQGSGSGSAVDWECGLACGTYMGMNLGDCPTGLTCQTNLCKP